MIALTLAEIAQIVGGTVGGGPGDVLVTNPAFADSRAVQPGGLFVAVPGEREIGRAHV